MLFIRCRIQSQNIDLRVHEQSVFVPNLVSLLTAAELSIEPGEVVCDLGCGSGLLSVLAAKMGAKQVLGIDLNPDALRDAEANARANGVADRCQFLLGSLLEPANGQKFNAIICTLPNVRSQDAPRYWGNSALSLMRSIDGGVDGEDLKVALIRRARQVLEPDGRLYLSNVDWCNPARSLEALAECGFGTSELAKACIPAWGRGSNTALWLKENPGRHRIDFQFAQEDGSLAVILEATAGSAKGGRKDPTMELDCSA